MTHCINAVSNRCISCNSVVAPIRITCNRKPTKRTISRIQTGMQPMIDVPGGVCCGCGWPRSTGMDWNDWLASRTCSNMQQKTTKRYRLPDKEIDHRSLQNEQWWWLRKVAQHQCLQAVEKSAQLHRACSHLEQTIAMSQIERQKRNSSDDHQVINVQSNQ